jgi:hypothetical protein
LFNPRTYLAPALNPPRFTWAPPTIEKSPDLNAFNALVLILSLSFIPNWGPTRKLIKGIGLMDKSMGIVR